MADTSSSVTFRRAGRDDVERIVQMLADDPLGAKRERYELPLPRSYLAAFEAIEADPNNEVVVACVDGKVIGVLQITFIPGLTYQGGWRALIEGVRVDAATRSSGLGKALVEHAIERARERGCHLVQLTTDKTRPGAKRFYEALGFVATHEGMKRPLTAR
ncbi:MAG TPA: GNAT family N-acetyltransferase [Burkholderiales bacterium]|jgi:ribosomal protein S18 acetylase RimI-like enzyme|nr:GNAT family N-acetyltransferase [Burkholderiales bacterium]